MVLYSRKSGWIALLFVLIASASWVVFRYVRSTKSGMAQDNVSPDKLSKQKKGTNGQLLSNEQLLLKERQMVEWRSGRGVPLIGPDPSELLVAVRTVRERECLDLPVDAMPVAPDDLSSLAWQSLDKSIAGLLQAYAKEDPDQLVVYMQEHGEALTKDFVDRLRTRLVKDYHFAAAQVKDWSDAEVFKADWVNAKCASHWAELVVDSSCCRLWRPKKGLENGRVAQKLGKGEADATLWRIW
jgi:hypothetical protein